jgi:hypothetical protein
VVGSYALKGSYTPINAVGHPFEIKRCKAMVPPCFTMVRAPNGIVWYGIGSILYQPVT